MVRDRIGKVAVYGYSEFMALYAQIIGQSLFFFVQAPELIVGFLFIDSKRLYRTFDLSLMSESGFIF